MKNIIITDLNTAVEKAIDSMEAYKANAEQYAKLVERIESIKVGAIGRLENITKKMPKDGIKQSLSIMGITGAKGLLTSYAQNAGGVTDKQGLQLIALIQKYL
jgi:hypothetical protein